MATLRGKKRYYKSLLNQEIPSWISFDNTEKNWSDFYHQHIDNRDRDNRTWRSRKQHLDALFILAGKYEAQLVKLKRDFQFWININDMDSEDDAIYLHTENPNGSEFPYKAPNMPELRSKNENLETYLASKDYSIIRFKVYDGDGRESINYYLQKDSVGKPIEII